jgi:addiction module HigA family antidote
MSLLEEYQLNPYSLSKEIGLSYSAVRQIVCGDSKLSVTTAFRLAKLFGQTPAYWLDLQRDADIREAASDKNLKAALSGITRVKKGAKPKAKAASPVKAKAKTKAPAARKSLADKRKTAAF